MGTMLKVNDTELLLIFLHAKMTLYRESPSFQEIYAKLLRSKIS